MLDFLSKSIQVVVEDKGPDPEPLCLLINFYWSIGLPRWC